MRRLVLGVGVLFGSACFAETVYVIDHLAVGVHEDKSLNGAIVKILPTGTPLDVLSRESDFVRIRTEDGLEGWVDANYVMPEKPAQLALLELEARYAEAAEALAAAQQEAITLNERLDLFEAQKREPPVAEQDSDTLREMQRLAEENQRLAGDLAQAQAAAAASEARQSTAPPMPAVSGTPGDADPPIGLSGTHWVMILALMVLAFGFGGYLVDLGVRRRHGGFRV